MTLSIARQKANSLPGRMGTHSPTAASLAGPRVDDHQLHAPLDSVKEAPHRTRGTSPIHQGSPDGDQVVAIGVLRSVAYVSRRHPHCEVIGAERAIGRDDIVRRCPEGRHPIGEQFEVVVRVAPIAGVRARSCAGLRPAPSAAASRWYSGPLPRRSLPTWGPGPAPCSDWCASGDS